jgi:hypothetical protein
MSSAPRVVRPARAADGLRPWATGMAAGLGLAAGLWLVAATLSPPPPGASGAPHAPPPPELAAGTASADAGSPPRKPTGGPAGEAGAAAEEGGTPAEEADTPAQEPGTEASTDTVPSGAPGPRPPPSGAAPRVVPGRVAYLQCEGVPLQKGPFPCPRDRALEGAAWEAIASLASCPTVPQREGEADVRLHFGSGEAPEVHFLGRATDLDEHRLRPCLVEPLTALRTSLEPEHMVVSFRFALVN